MKKKFRRRMYPEEQLAGLRASTTSRKQATVERLHAAIDSLKEKKQVITAQTIYEECGLHYATYIRNETAIALFRANSTHLQEQKKRTKHKGKVGTTSSQPPRDPLLHYKKSQLADRLREAQQQIHYLGQQQTTLIESCLQHQAQVVELKTKLAELEPYRNFVEQVRLRVQQQEHGDQGTTL